MLVLKTFSVFFISSWQKFILRSKNHFQKIFWKSPKEYIDILNKDENINSHTPIELKKNMDEK